MEKLCIIKYDSPQKEKTPIIDGLEKPTDLGYLQDYASKCLEIVKKHEDVDEAEIFASTYDRYICEISFSTGFPSTVVTPKYKSGDGISIRVFFDDGTVAQEGARKVTTVEQLEHLLNIAREGAVHDPDFVSFPMPVEGETPETDPSKMHFDENVMNLGSAGVTGLAYKVVDGALKIYEGAIQKGILDMKYYPRPIGGGQYVPDRRTNITLHGDIRSVTDLMAVESTTGINASEAHTMLSGSVMTGWETASPNLPFGFEGESKARGRGSSVYLTYFNPEEIGASAARKALIFTGKGIRLESGEHTAVLSPQAVSELMAYLGGPSLNILGQEFKDSMFPLDEIGKQVISEMLSIYDDPTIHGAMSSRCVTSEGIPTKKTTLIAEGVFNDVIKDTYYSNKYRAVLEALGIDTTPRNGLRLDEGFNHPGWPPRPIFTNLVIEGNGSAVPLDDMLSDLEVGEKLVYIGELWYSYPTHKGRKDTDHSWGSMTSSSPAGSYLLENKDGEIEKTLIKPNTFRMYADVRDLLSRVDGVSTEKETIYGWAANNTVIAPYIRVPGIQLVNVAEYMP